MKKYFLSVAIAASVFFIAHPANADITTGLVGHWAFDEGSGLSAGDSSGSGNTGTLENGPSWTTGHIGSGALNFDGADDYVNTNYGPNISSSESMTLSAWFKTTNNSGTDFVIASSIGDSYFNIATVHGTCTPSGKLIFEAGDDTTNNQFTCSTTAYNDGNWHLATGVLDRVNNNIYLYIDGNLESTASISALTGSIDFTGYPFFVGARNNGGVPQQRYLGEIDDVRIYDRVLSSAEVTELYNNSGGSPSPVGDIVVQATLDGQPWPSSGTANINYEIIGPVTLNGSIVPDLFSGVPADDDIYSISHISGEPPGAPAGSSPIITPWTIFIPAGGQATAQFSIEVPASTLDGNYSIVIEGSGGSNPRTTIILKVEIKDPIFREV